MPGLAGIVANYDVSRDGKSFLVIGIGNNDLAEHRIVVVTGWLDELTAQMSQVVPRRRR